MIEFPAPTCPPTAADRLSKGVDCCRHPAVPGCIVANNGTPPGQQARNYLLSLRQATIHQVAGRAGDLSEEEFKDLFRKLLAWEAAGNAVAFPAPAIDHQHRR
jgi:hypothetical protein